MTQACVRKCVVKWTYMCKYKSASMRTCTYSDINIHVFVRVYVLMLRYTSIYERTYMDSTVYLCIYNYMQLYYYRHIWVLSDSLILSLRIFIVYPWPGFKVRMGQIYAVCNVRTVRAVEGYTTTPSNLWKVFKFDKRSTRNEVNKVKAVLFFTPLFLCRLCSVLYVNKKHKDISLDSVMCTQIQYYVLVVLQLAPFCVLDVVWHIVME